MYHHHNLCILGSWSAEAGLMSGSPGIESIPGPELPKLEFLDRFNGTILFQILEFFMFCLPASRKMLVNCS